MQTKLFGLGILLASCLCGTAWAGVWYVDDDAVAGGSGLAWESAVQTIEAAVAAADVYDEIWIADGTYTPVDTVELKVGQELYGGFVGNELDRLSRSAEYYALISCLGQYDTFEAQPECRFDGLAIEDKDWGGDEIRGHGDIVLTNCSFSRTYIWLSGGQNVVENCSFTDWGTFSSSPKAPGDGLDMIRCSSANNSFSVYDHDFRSGVSFDGCTFSGSNVSCNGLGNLSFYRCVFINSGGVLKTGVNNFVSINECWFSGCWSQDDDGSAYHSSGDFFVTVCDTTFANNRDKSAFVFDHEWISGVFVPEIQMDNCRFVGNEAEAGGAIMLMDVVADIDGCTFDGNVAGAGGGAIFASNSSATLANCLFDVNMSGETGGALDLSSLSEISLTNCTLWGNVSGQGGAIMASQGSLAQLTNCIVAESAPDAFATSGISAAVEAEFSCIEGGAPGEGNVDGPPLLADPANDFFLPLWGSPCIDTGTNEGVPAADLLGTPRPQLAGVDMGAFEFVMTDGDNDGMDDYWEDFYGLDPTDPDDADEDADGDGVTNGQEAAIMNNPQDPDDCRDEYFVSISGSDTEGDGSAAAPWATIGKAMGHAGGFSMFKPVTINVASGVYDEQVVFAPGVTLAGAGAGSTKIQYFELSEDEHFVVIGAEGAKLKECTVQVSGQYSASFALLKLDDVSMEVEDVTFDGDDNLYSLGALISGENSSDTEFDGCTFRRLYFGVQAVNTAANVTNTTFSGIRGDAIFVRLPDTKKYGAVVYTPVLGDAAQVSTTGNNTFRNVMGNLVLNMNTATTKAENNDWGVYTESEIAAKMAGAVDYKPFIGEQADDGDGAGCFAVDKTSPATRGSADALVMFVLAGLLVAGGRRKRR